MFGEIMAALKAVPLIVEKLDQLSEAINGARDAALERELAKTKEEINEITKQLQNSPSRDRLIRLVADLNRL